MDMHTAWNNRSRNIRLKLKVLFHTFRCTFFVQHLTFDWNYTKFAFDLGAQATFTKHPIEYHIIRSSPLFFMNINKYREWSNLLFYLKNPFRMHDSCVEHLQQRQNAMRVGWNTFWTRLNKTKFSMRFFYSSEFGINPQNESQAFSSGKKQ